MIWGINFPHGVTLKPGDTLKVTYTVTQNDMIEQACRKILDKLESELDTEFGWDKIMQQGVGCGGGQCSLNPPAACCSHIFNPATNHCMICGVSKFAVMMASSPPPGGYGIDGVEWDDSPVQAVDNGPAIKIRCMTCKKQEVRSKFWLEGDGWKDIEIDYNSPASDPSYVGVCRGCP